MLPTSHASDTVICICGKPNPDWRAALQGGLPGGITLFDANGDPAQALSDAGRRFPQRDLILLAADCWLPPQWFERICHALRQDNVAAVQALTPELLPGIDWPADRDVLTTLDRRCFAYGSREALDSETLDAPLIAVRSEAVDWLTPHHDSLDVSTVPAPWRVLQLENLLAASTQSRAAATHTPYRAVAQTIAQSLADDAAVVGYPGLDAKPVLLHILHGWGGGAARWVEDFAAADTYHHHLVLEAHGDFKRRRHGERLRLRIAGRDLPPLREFEPPVAIAATALTHPAYAAFLRAVIADYGVDALILSSLIGHSLDALRTGLPTTIIVHDHFPLWPLLHRNFGDPELAFDAAQRQTDLAATGSDFEFADRDAGTWLRLRDAYVHAALNVRATLVAPSRSAMAAQLRLAPELKTLPQHIIAHGMAPWPPHDALPVPPPRKRLRLLVPGRVRRGKGAQLLHAALPKLREYADIVLLGAGAEGMEFFCQSDVHVILQYDRDDLPQLMASLAPDAALLLSTVAETFSYALSEMRSLGVPVIATRIGALAERIDDGADGVLVEATSEALVDAVAALAQHPQRLLAMRQQLADIAVTDRTVMADDYRKLLALAARQGARYRVAIADVARLDARSERGHAMALQDTLQDQAATLADQQALATKRTQWAMSLESETRLIQADLRQRTAWAESLEADLADRTVWAKSLDTELGELRPLAEQRGALIEQMLHSRSWRLTAPLRHATDFYRRARASLRFRAARLRSLSGRVRASLGRRGVRGTLSRIRDEFAHQQVAPKPMASPPPDTAFTPFAMATSDAPQVSIVIPIHNKIEYTVACLRSLTEHAGSGPAFEVIVVDDASSDASAEQLAQIDGIRVLHNAQNLGFVGSCNAGAAAARGDYVLFLNNDTLVTGGWLRALLDCFEQCPDAGLVGAKLVYPDGRLQEAGGIVFRDGSGWNYGRFDNPDDPRYNFRRRADYCSGAAIMLRHALFNELGGFDTRYAPAYYEDTDLAFAVRAAGLQVYYEPRATVIHFEGITAGTDTGSGMKRYQAINQEKFVAKWADALTRQPAPIERALDAHLAATFGANKRVLIVDASTPTPDQDSGSVRLTNIMCVLRDMGCQVTFLPDNLARIERYTEQLQALGVEAIYHPFVADTPAFYRARGREFDLIMISRHYIAAHHLGLVRAYAPQARLVFDTVDLHYLREQRAAELDPRPELKRQAETTRMAELKLIRECDVTVVVSSVEKTLLASEAPQASVEILSNVHAVTGSRAPFEQRADLLFVGGFQHPPNADAMLWFVSDILPRIRQHLPQVRLHLVGSKMPDNIKALASDAVIVHGFVENIEPLLDSCRISVAPMRYGAGVKGKVNMAMSYGLPVVATPMAVEGIDAIAGEDVLVAETADAFADAVARLYNNSRLWRQLSQRGADNVRRQFSFDAARTALQRLLPAD